MERWRPITEYNMFAFDGRFKYEVSSLGNVRRAGYYGGRRKFFEPVPLTPRKDKRTGRYGITLIFEGQRHYFLIDKLVATAFLKKPDGANCVIHKDGDICNSHLENLRWGFEDKTRRGCCMGRAVQQFTPDGEFVAEYKSLTAAGRAVGVTRTSITRCCQNGAQCVGYVWKFVNGGVEIG